MLGAKRWDVLVKVGLPRSMPYFYASLKVAITLAFVGTTVSEMTASNEGIITSLISGRLVDADGLAFAGLVVVGAMAMGMYELFSRRAAHHGVGAPGVERRLSRPAVRIAAWTSRTPT